MERIIITRSIIGLCYMQVCCVKDASNAEILDKCNKDNPSGTEQGWQIVIRDDSSGYSEKQKPVQCQDHKDRVHMMVVC